jgi:hypothetical protein
MSWAKGGAQRLEKTISTEITNVPMRRLMASTIREFNKRRAPQGDAVIGGIQHRDRQPRRSRPQRCGGRRSHCPSSAPRMRRSHGLFHRGIVRVSDGPHEKVVSVQDWATRHTLRGTHCLRMIRPLGLPTLNTIPILKWMDDTWQPIVWLALKRSLS